MVADRRALTLREQQLHAELFDPASRVISPVADEDMWRVLRELRDAPALGPFRLWLVGSRVEAGNTASDIDLVLSARGGTEPRDESIEAALWTCRHHGLKTASPRCIVDPCFRPAGPARTVVALRSGSPLRTAKLYSPQLMRLVLSGTIRGYRRFGDFSIEYVRFAGHAGFYDKLPRRPFGDHLCAYLRPAIEIAEHAT